MAMTFGYAELTPEGRHFNTSILVDREGRTVGLYRKVHLPGHVEFDPERTHQHLEKRYFEPGDLGFRSGARWAASSACASATTGAGPRSIASWGCRASRW